MTAQLAAGVATAVSAAFAVSLLMRWWRRGRPGRREPALLLWGIALTLFAVASGALLLGVVGGFSRGEFAVFYLLGGALNVPWLAVGSIAVNARARVVSRVTGAALLVVALLLLRAALGAATPALWWPGVALAAAWGALLVTGRRDAIVRGAVTVLLGYSALATVMVLRAVADVELPATGLPEGRDLLAPAVRGYAVGGNAVGALTVVVGALAASAGAVWSRPERSADRDVLPDVRRLGYVDALARWVFRGRTGRGPALAHLVRGNLMIALGTAVAGLGGVLSFLGDTVGHAVGFTIGVSMMYGGFLRTTRTRADAPTVVLYTRARCGVCARAERLVRREARGADVRLVDVDVAGLVDRYGVRVPVVEVDGVEVAELEIAPGEVAAAVAAAVARSADRAGSER